MGENVRSFVSAGVLQRSSKIHLTLFSIESQKNSH